MKSRDFAFWLQGFFELSGGEQITPEQAKLIKVHLGLVFAHDPDIAAKPHQTSLFYRDNTQSLQGIIDTSATLIC